MSELRELCFELNIDYENLSGDGKSDKARALVQYALRHRRYPELAAKVRQLRPNEIWEDVASVDQESLVNISVPHIFISYSRRDSDAIEVLTRELRARGLRIWRDIDSLLLGRLAETEIRQALREVDAAILYLTRESIKSDYILSVELPEIIARHQRQSDFPVIMILDGVTFAQVDRATRAVGRHLSDFNARVLPPATDAITRRAQLAEVSRAILASVLKPHLEYLSAGQAVHIDLFSYKETPYDVPAMVRLDWVKQFNPALPSAEMWHGLMVALDDLCGVLRSGGLRPIRVRPAGAHLSAGLAFGYTFRETTGFHLQVEQPIQKTNQSQWWRTDEPPQAGAPLVQTSLLVDPNGRDTAVEVSIASNVGPAVSQYLTQHSLPIRERIQFSMPADTGNPIVADGPHALSMACQIRNAIKAVRQTYPQQTVHLFFSGPIGLAVLIGAQMNACEPVQCYEYKRAENIYIPSCLLVPR